MMNMLELKSGEVIYARDFDDVKDVLREQVGEDLFEFIHTLIINEIEYSDGVDKVKLLSDEVDSCYEELGHFNTLMREVEESLREMYGKHVESKRLNRKEVFEDINHLIKMITNSEVY